MSADPITLSVGQVMPDCQIPLRADGTVRCDPGTSWQPGYFLDPVHITLVLGADVSPWHEQAIMRACQHDQEQDLAVLDDASRRRLWMWDALSHMMLPHLGVHLLLRPGAVQLPQLSWFVPYPVQDVCPHCAEHMGDDCLGALERISGQATKGLTSRIILVGRDHRVLSLTVCALHHDLAMMWLTNVGMGCGMAAPSGQGSPSVQAWVDECHGPDPAVHLWHVVGQRSSLLPHEVQPWLVANGWRETPQELRLRRRRGHAARRARQ